MHGNSENYSEMKPFYRWAFQRNIPVYREDRFMLTVVSVEPSQQIYLEAHLTQPDGISHIVNRIYSPLNDGTVETFPFDLNECILQHLTLRCSVATTRRQSTFVQLALYHYTNATSPLADILISGDLVGGMARAVGDGMNKGIGEAEPLYGAVAIADPAAGADLSYTNSAGVEREIVALQGTLITGVAVGNRVFRVVYGGPTTPNFVIAEGVTQIASLSVEYDFNLGITAPTSSATHKMYPLPFGIVLRPGDFLYTDTSGLDAADQFSNWGFAYRQRLSL